MNAPAGIIKAPAWKNYLPMVDTFCAGASPDERRVRARMMALRDVASEARHDPGNLSADMILTAVQRLGLVHATAPAPLHNLQAIGESMAELLTIAAKVSVYGGDE